MTTPTFNAYGGERIHQGPGFSTLNFSDQDIHSALLRMASAPEFMPGFLRWHRLSPAQVVAAIDTVNGDQRGAETVRLFVDLYPQIRALRAWYDANPLPQPTEA